MKTLFRVNRKDGLTMNNKYDIGFTFKEYLPEEPWEDCPAMIRNYEIIAVSPTESVCGYVYFVKHYIDSGYIFYESYNEEEIAEYVLRYEEAKEQFNLA